MRGSASDSSASVPLRVVTGWRSLSEAPCLRAATLRPSPSSTERSETDRVRGSRRRGQREGGYLTFDLGFWGLSKSLAALEDTGFLGDNSRSVSP